MTLEEFKNKIANGDSSPTFVRKVVQAMSELDSSALYKNSLIVSGGREPYGVFSVKQICMRLNEEYGSEQMRKFGAGLLQLVRDFPDEADIASEDQMYSYYIDILKFLSMLPAGFVPQT